MPSCSVWARSSRESSLLSSCVSLARSVLSLIFDSNVNSGERQAGTLQILNFNAVRGTYSATLVSLVEALDRRTLKPDYSKTSTSGIDLMEQATAPPALQLILQSLAHHSNKEGEVIMLDNACGAGIVSKCILEMQLEKAGRKLEVVAGDFEPKMVGLMQARIEKNAWSAKAMVVDAQVRPLVLVSDLLSRRVEELIRELVQAIPFPDSYFTHVATNFAIQLLPDSVLALKGSLLPPPPSCIH